MTRALGAARLLHPRRRSATPDRRPVPREVRRSQEADVVERLAPVHRRATARAEDLVRRLFAPRLAPAPQVREPAARDVEAEALDALRVALHQDGRRDAPTSEATSRLEHRLYPVGLRARVAFNHGHPFADIRLSASTCARETLVALVYDNVERKAILPFVESRTDATSPFTATTTLSTGVVCSRETRAEIEPVVARRRHDYRRDALYPSLDLAIGIVSIPLFFSGRRACLRRREFLDRADEKRGAGPRLNV